MIRNNYTHSIINGQAAMLLIAINSTRQFDKATCDIFTDSQRVCKYGKETDE